MFENNIFDDYLELESKRVLKKLNDNELLTQDDKLIMVLKSQTNHFYHLDIELKEDIKFLREDTKKANLTLMESFEKENRLMREEFEKENRLIRKDFEKDIKLLREDSDKRFEQVEKRFEQVDKRFDSVILRMDRFMIWSLGLTFSSTLFLVAFMVNYFDR